MADEQLGAILDLDINSALASVESLGSALDSTSESSANTLSEALSAAIEAVPEVSVEADASAVEPAITGAVDAADASVEVDAEGAESITGDIESAIDAADTTAEVEVDADTTSALDAIDSISASIDPVELDVDVDTESAQGALDDLGSSAGGAGAQMQSASGSADSLSGAAGGLESAGGLATGSWSALGTAVGSMTGGAGKAVAVIGAVAGATGLMFSEAVEATGATQRFEGTLGTMADRVENLRNIEGLNTNLGDLALQLGSDDDKIRSVAARMFELGTASGKTKTETSLFVQQMIALGARAVALNPELGDVGDVTDSLGTALVKGGKFASKFGLDLSSAEINSRAMTMANKDSTAELSFVEKAMAGAAIASERYGSNLATIVAEGSENAITKQRRLQQTVRESIEALGMPLVAPIFKIMEGGIPVAEAMGKLLQNLAVAVLPGLVASFKVIVPVAEAFSKVLDVIGPALGPLTAGFLAFQAVTSLLPIVIGGAVTGLLSIVSAAPAAAAAIGLTATAIEAAEVGISTALPVIGLVVGALAIGATAFGLFGGGADEAEKKVGEFGDALEKANGQLDESARKAARAILDEKGQIDDLGNAGLKLNQILKATNTTSAEERSILGQVATSVDQLSVAKAAYANKTVLTKDRIRELSAEQRALIADLRATNPALGEIVASTLAADSSNKGFVETLRSLATESATTKQRLHEQAAGGADDATIAADATRNQAMSQEELTTAVESYASTVTGVMPGVSGAFDNAKAAAEHYGQALSPEVLLAGLQATLSATVNFTNNLKVIFDAGFTDLGALMQTKGAEAGGATTQAIADAIRTGHPETAASLNETAAQVTVAGALAAEYATTTGNQVVANTGTQYARLSPLVAHYMGLSAAEIGAWTPRMTTMSENAAAAGIIMPMDSGLAPLPGKVGAVMSNTTGAVAAAQGPMQGAAQGVGGANVTGLGTGMAPGPGLAKGVANQIVGAMGGNESLARSAGYVIGWSFVSGMNVGLGSIDVSSTVVNLVNNAFRAGQNALDAKSPSKRARDELGIPFAQGIGVGIEKGAPGVLASVDDLLGSVLSSPVLAPAATTFRPAAGATGRQADGSTYIEFNVEVHGVTDPAVARKVGKQVGQGAVDAMTRRNVVTQARLG